MEKVQRDTWIEDLVDTLPESVSFLIERGMKPLACGEPVWETVEGLAKSKGISDGDIDALVRELNRLKQEKQASGA